MATPSPIAPQRLTMEIGDHPRCHGPFPFSGIRGRKMPKGPRIVHPVNGGKHQPLQGQRRAGGEQCRQRTGRHFAQEIAARAGKVDAAELQDVVAPGVVQLPGAKRVVLLVAMFWRGFEGFFQRVRSAGIGIGDDELGLHRSPLPPRRRTPRDDAT
jgi:hypothetical protein